MCCRYPNQRGFAIKGCNQKNPWKLHKVCSLFQHEMKLDSYSFSFRWIFKTYMRVWGYCLSCNDIWGYHHKVRWERTGRSAHVQDISHVSQTDPLINRPGSWDEASQWNVSSPTVFFSTYANTYYWLYFCLLPTQFWVKNVVLDSLDFQMNF